MKQLLVWLMRAWQALLDTVFPSDAACLICGELPPSGSSLCEGCRDAMAQLRLKDGTGHVQGAAATLSCWIHAGIPRKLVHQLKYSGIPCAASVLADTMAEAAKTLPLPENTVVTWVTMGEHKRRERGVDHGRLLAEAVAERLSLPCRQVMTRLEKKGEHTQQGLNRADRLSNLQDRFVCQPLRGGCYLLVDDVLTTGATAAACTEVMLRAGARRVMVLTATRAGG